MQVLQRIQQLLGSMAETVDTILRCELFLQRLLSNVQMVLTPSAAALSLNQLAQLADRIVEASPTLTILAIDTHMHSQLTVQVTELTQCLDQLTSQMSSAINNPSKRQTYSPSPGRRRRHPSTSTGNRSQSLYWYHHMFKDNTKKCQPPCKKSGND